MSEPCFEIATRRTEDDDQFFTTESLELTAGGEDGAPVMIFKSKGVVKTLPLGAVASIKYGDADGQWCPCCGRAIEFRNP